ncbi:MAG TPA: DUF1801 domain-containing protein [Longimicrobiales bacterium]
MVSTVDEYIRAQAPRTAALLRELREVIQRAAPEAAEKISYRVPTFYYRGNLVHFGAFRNHIGFYPGPSGIAAFEDELQRYRHAKGSVQFPLDAPLPLDLVSRIVAFRVSENARKPARARPKAT